MARSRPAEDFLQPWTKAEHMAEVCGRNYVLSLKPSSAVFAHDTYDEDLARRELQEKLDALKGCNFEIIIKDISTVCATTPSVCGNGLQWLMI